MKRDLFTTEMGLLVSAEAEKRGETPEAYAVALARGANTYGAMVRSLVAMGHAESAARSGLSKWLREFRAQEGIEARGGASRKRPGVSEKLLVSGLTEAELMSVKRLSPTERARVLVQAASSRT